ncbi:bifunctional diguanylate cyclase/phosphodiesterase [Sphingomonas sp. C3-2]|uniref:putative bifunctional diguanylate cyclase/phosphodiesterase n=1 Tax=Sphingomonas sp. C3-2 TaxID=3062169 RepID=UPI00294AA546|nr:bifunctional diguanylate cyclase/phosphodiesterase [Sphingomonas sp. C3-2]WOK37716.1 bifunctional diguanylate cyclase/phosphodiesterase [Sphingomonas sp. C3-2]
MSFEQGPGKYGTALPAGRWGRLYASGRNRAGQILLRGSQLLFRAALPLSGGITGQPLALLGRQRFLNMLGEALNTLPSDKSLAIMMIDLNRFRLLNAMFGHEAGDMMLEQIHLRISAIVDGLMGSTVHLGNDGFACLIVHPRCVDQTEAIAERILQAIAEPISHNGKRALLSASLGIASDRDGQTPDELLRAASVAMVRAKRDHGQQWCRFDAQMDAVMRDREALGGDLFLGITRGEIRPHYQPIMRLADGALIGFESLARWHHPLRGLLDPGQFIPLAEDLDAIDDLCFAMLGQSCRHARDWPKHATLSINISPFQICDPQLPLRLLRTLRAGRFPPSRLIVEITESALVRDLSAARSTIESLRAAGIRIALDDFGTGYSSLHRLRELQFDRIKVDRSFIAALDGSSGDKIVQAIISLADTLNIAVTAEGIETQEQIDALSRLGCTFGQGYLLGRPMPAEDAARIGAAQTPFAGAAE